MRIRLHTSDNKIIESGEIAPDFARSKEYETERKIIKWISSVVKRDKTITSGEIIYTP